ncbi:MAG: hypothetical protein HQ542_01155, partial [Bacteroidia bacterium]|nr:hypothetical protein [Bacteroidia bacterium]
MQGFNLSIGSLKLPIHTFGNRDYLTGSINEQDFRCDRFSLNKFQNDKIFFENERYFVILDGIVLNKADLSKDHMHKSWSHLVINLYESNGDAFVNDFRGSFCGALFDKTNRKWIIFSDHIGSKFLYFTKRNNNLAVSTGMGQMYQILKINNINYQLDEQAAYMLLSYGYMLEDYTLCSEVKKLKAGNYLVFKDGSVNIRQYYTIPHKRDEFISEE